MKNEVLPFHLLSGDQCRAILAFAYGFASVQAPQISELIREQTTAALAAARKAVTP